ncbi:MAG: glycosyltransferase [Patescibacteria group bacterium]|nr:hypothetical protein [Patescibacteria group bacterium]
MKKVLVFTSRFGHKSLAEAVVEAFKKAGWQTDVFYHSFEGAGFFYNFTYMFFPTIFQPIFELTSKKSLRNVIKRYSKIIKSKEIEAKVRQYQPDLVISTYFLFNYKIEELKKKHGFKFINLITDPRTFNLLNLSKKAEANLAYDSKTKKDLIAAFKAKPEKISATGWLVRERFYKKGKRKVSDKERMTILVCGGSLGTGAILKFLPLFLNFRKNLKLIIVAGKSKILYQTVKLFEEIVEIQKETTKKTVKLEVHRFTSKIDRLIAEADLVAGKAGPNLLFETVAAGKPFLALTHIHGQENGNLEIIKEKGLGWVAETTKEAKAVLAKIASDPKFLAQKVETVLKEREINLLSAEKMVAIAERLSVDSR